MSKFGWVFFLLALEVAGASLLHAQDAVYDPNQLPTYKGQLQLFTLTPRGDIDGLVMTDGTEVKTPPHLSTQLALTVRPGDAITVHGLKAARLPLVQAMSITNDATGRSVIDAGPGDRPAGRGFEKSERGQVAGRVRMRLHGPRGDVNGVLLEDGTILRLAPADADRFSALLSPGHAIAAEGTTHATAAGKLVDITALGTSAGDLAPVE